MADDPMVWDDARIDEEFQKSKMFPLRMEMENIPLDAIRLYALWAEKLKLQFQPEQTPWVPVGAVGPILLLGHSQPEKMRAPIPAHLAQHVLLSPRQHQALIPIVAGALKNFQQHGMMSLPDKNPIVGLKPVLNTPSEILEFLISSMVMSRAHRDIMQNLRVKAQTGMPEWPDSYGEAVQFLQGRAMLVDVRVMAPDVETAQTITDQIRYQAHAIGAYSTERYHYIAVPKVPNGPFEDMVMSMAQGMKKRGVRLLLAPQSVLRDTLERRASQRTRTDLHTSRSAAAAGRTITDQTKPNVVIDTKRMEVLDKTPKSDLTRLSNDERWHYTIWRGFRGGASDLHYEQVNGRGRVRARVDGILRVIDEPSDACMRGMIGVAKGGAIPGFTQNNHDRQDARATIRIGDALVNIRASLVPHRRDGYQVMVLRLLPKNTNLLKLGNLGTSERNVRILRRAVNAARGIIFITGPTGSGKTTTLYAGLQEINKDDLKINTIEDPVEIELEGATQSMVDVSRGVDFDDLMEGVLRQDPDVILIGEIRSKITARLALEAAQTGHLVFVTVHTNDEVEAISRMMGLIDDPKLLPVLARNCTLLQAQRLVQKLCPDCSKEVDVTAEEAAIFEKHKLPKATKVRKANHQGCTKCYQGYSGRLAIMALLPVTKGFARKISNGADAFELREEADKAGFKSLYREALERVQEGLIDFREADLQNDPWEDFNFEAKA